MTALPYSLFKIVQGLCYPRRSNVCSYGPWSTDDFSTSQNIQSEVAPDTDVVLITLQDESLDLVLKRFSHIDYKFNLIISSYEQEKLTARLHIFEHTIISSSESHYALMIHNFSKGSFVKDCISRGVDVEIDDDCFFIPNFDPAKWSQENGKIIFESPEGLVVFEVPSNFSLARTSPDLLWLVEVVLLSPWHKDYLLEWVPTRRPGNKPALSFSGGVDSTAALCLMPEDTVLLYMERDFESMIKHENAHHFLSELRKKGKTVVNVQSNHEFIRTNHGKNFGFSTDYACMAHLILLADYLDLDAAATSMPLENTYFFHGSIVRDFSKTRFWKYHSAIFNYIGLPIYQPVAGCSEVLNNEIVKLSPYHELATSCLRSSIVGEKCESCWKCFRKNIFNDKPWKMSNEISKFLTKRPLKQGLATLYALQIMKESGQAIPNEAHDLLSLVDMNMSFLVQYWAPSIDLVPDKYQEYTRKEINRYATPMITDLLAIDKRMLNGLRGEAI